jgi:hypothetical protein
MAHDLTKSYFYRPRGGSRQTINIFPTPDRARSRLFAVECRYVYASCCPQNFTSRRFKARRRQDERTKVAAGAARLAPPTHRAAPTQRRFPSSDAHRYCTDASAETSRRVRSLRDNHASLRRRRTMTWRKNSISHTRQARPH